MTVPFGCMHKIFYNIVMSIVNKTTTNNNSSPVTETREEFDLNKLEIEYLLDLIKNSSFPGSHLETLYSIVYKLQQQYLKQK